MSLLVKFGPLARSRLNFLAGARDYPLICYSVQATRAACGINILRRLTLTGTAQVRAGLMKRL
jgi:hypothetical protein